MRSRADYESIYRESIDHPQLFYRRVANELHWFQDYTDLVSFDAVHQPSAKWFIGGQTNISYNCLDRNIQKGLGQKVAIYSESELGVRKAVTYLELHQRVQRFANVLIAHGVQVGDRVVLYMPMTVDAVVAMQACARIGAIHSVVFAGFSAEALKDRLIDAQASFVVTADATHRKGQLLPLKSTVDQAIESGPLVKAVFVFNNSNSSYPMVLGRDVHAEEAMATASAIHDAVSMPSEAPLFILYTSGSTGKPKGVLHSTAGFMVHTYLTAQLVFDFNETDIFWCTADVGWITGHSYVAYSPLLNGVTQVIYEGAPMWPEPDRFWKIIESHRVSILYTAPTAIRAFMKAGDQWLEKCNLDSLRLLGSVGEPINPEAWHWYYERVGQGRCPIVDTWWQTETGGIMLSTLPGAMPAKPGKAGLAMPGVQIEILKKDGQDLGEAQGYLAIKGSWPSMIRTVFGNEERFINAYFKEFPGYYFAGDGASQDEDGYVQIIGRVDDVLNVSGHRLGTMEIESALVGQSGCVEAAIVARPDTLTGEAVVAFVVIQSGVPDSESKKVLETELKQAVSQKIGAIARPQEIRFVEALPKTRSGKIMRRLLKDIAQGRAPTGDLSTLEDQSLLKKLLN